MNLILLFTFSAIIIVGGALFFLMTFGRSKSTLDVDSYRKKWLEIENILQKNQESTYHLAIIRADSMLDMALKEAGYLGNTMAERLVSSKSRYSNNKALWLAHKLRNKVVHEPDFKTSYRTTRRVLMTYKRALKDIGAV